MTFEVNSEDVKLGNSIQLTVMLEIKLQKYIFEQIMGTFLAANMSFLEPCYDLSVHMYDTI